MTRHSQQKARLLDEGIIAGFERRCSAADQPKEPLREIYELRAIGRELIGHVNALEAERIDLLADIERTKSVRVQFTSDRAELNRKQGRFVS